VITSPGKAIPTAGETLSQVAPAVALNEIGAPLVVNVTICATDGLGGAMKLSVLGVTAKVDGAAVTVSVTVTTAGEATPTTVIVTAELYVPTGSPVGFTSTPMDAGKLPLSIFTVSQKSVGGVDVTNAGFPVLGFTAIDCAFGNAVAPD
jgi:hypothetical protein